MPPARTSASPDRTPRPSPTVEIAGPGWTYLALSGALDRAPAPPRARLAPLVLVDLEGVGRVTSSGARELATWVEQLGGSSRNVVLVDCPPPVVALLNLIRSFLGTATVLSIRAPYYCEQCGAERALSIPVEALVGKDVPEAPPLLCEEDGATLVFDDIEKSYFAFASRVRYAKADPDLLRLVARARRRAAGELPDEPAPTPREPHATSLTMPPQSLAPTSPSTNVPLQVERALDLRLPPADRAFWVVVGALGAVLALVAYHLVR
jgi:hypothetical protein